MTTNRLADDLNQIVEHQHSAFAQLIDSHVLITGGTGFVGTWLVESLLWAHNLINGEGFLTVVSRNPQDFLNKNPHLADHKKLQFLQSDIRNLDLSNTAAPQYVIHAATAASADLTTNNPDEMLSVIVDGQDHLFQELSRFLKCRVLFTSSGAVYGPQPGDVSNISEDFPIPTSGGSVYHQGKRLAEQLCLTAQTSGIADVTIARLFAFVGPHLPLDAHFAIGNFIRDALAGGPIIIKGDGTTIRSYQYASDMAEWLIKMLIDGRPGRAYNVGSDQGLNMRQIAETVAQAIDPAIKVEVRGTPDPSKPIDVYVPSTKRAKTELGLISQVKLVNAISRTATFNRTR